MKLDRDEWIISKKAALDHFLGRDQLEELNRQPAHWPMKEGPVEKLRRISKEEIDWADTPWELQEQDNG